MPEPEEKKFKDLEDVNALKISPLNEKYSIGMISHGPELTDAVNGGKVESLTRELSSLYREVYGREPWNEYLVCSGRDCGKKTGLLRNQEMAAADRKILSGEEQPRCPKCSASMEFFYHPEKIIASLQQALRDKIFLCLLLDQDRNMEGFSLGFETTVRDGYRDKVIVGTGDTDPQISYEEYLAGLHHSIGHFDEANKLINLAEWGTSPRVRGDKVAFPLLHSVLKLAKSKMTKLPEEDVPGIAHTLNGTKAFNLMQQLGKAGPVNPKTNEVRIYSTINYAIKKIESFNK